ncbi:MAG: AAA family ATPase [Bacillota bacterium]
MIDHVHIRNFMAFKDETVVLGNHTLFIGTSASGKTTLLRALDLFFNHALDYQDVRNKQKPIVIECSIDETTYKKVFSPPHFTFDPTRSAGPFQKLVPMKYLYLPSKPHSLSHFINQCLSIHYTPKEGALTNPDVESDDFVLAGPSGPVAPAYQVIKTKVLNNDSNKKAKRVEWIERFHNGQLYIGADDIEKSIRFKDLKTLIDLSAQALFVSKQNPFINAFPYRVHPLYKTDVQREMDTLTKPIKKSTTFLLVEGKYDVPWYESALRILNREHAYRVIPSGGSGNLRFVDEQLKKAGFKTLVVSDGDVDVPGYTLQRDIIELYVDPEFLRKHFNTSMKRSPKTKRQFFDAIQEKDDDIKKGLARYATYHLYLSHPFVKELEAILKDYEN